MSFFDRECNLRQVTNFPPFAKIARILITGENELLTQEVSGQIFEDLKPLREEYRKDFVYFAGMRSPVSKIQNKFRFQILMRFKLDNEKELVSKIYQIVDKHTHPKLQIFVELNPTNLS